MIKLANIEKRWSLKYSKIICVNSYKPNKSTFKYDLIEYGFTKEKYKSILKISY